VVFHELFGVGPRGKGDQLPAHGPVYVASHHEKGLAGIDQRNGVIVRDKYRANHIGRPVGMVNLDVEKILEKVLGPVEKHGHPVLVADFGHPVRILGHEHAAHRALVFGAGMHRQKPFYVMPKTRLKTLENIFRAKVFQMLRQEGKITDAIINNLMNWRHSGFSIHNGIRVARDNKKGRENLGQYIIRNTFSVEKIKYIEKTSTVIYHSKMNHGKNKNFEVYKAEEFIAAITQHIPEKSFQMVRYYGWYSNKKRGMRLKQGIHRPGDESLTGPNKNVKTIDVSEYQPKKIPSKTWRECIKKIWEADPLLCPNCGGEMKIISFITDPPVVRHILEYVGLWEQRPSRDPPEKEFLPDIVYEPFDDGWPGYEEVCI